VLVIFDFGFCLNLLDASLLVRENRFIGDWEFIGIIRFGPSTLRQIWEYIWFYFMKLETET
jgi:hypothetical protein